MSALNIKSDEKDYNEITFIAWCVSLIIERLGRLVLEAGPRKLMGWVSME